MQLSTMILFATIVMATYFIEGIIGFGGTILALPLASMALGNDMKTTVIVLTIVVLFASIFIAIRDFKHIDEKQFFKITLHMAIGIPLGMIALRNMPERPLKIALAIFMIFVGAKGFYDSLNSKKNYSKFPTSKVQKIKETVILFLGGVIHGAFTCGGPFVVVYATKNIKDKSSFRATLCALWATLNTLMLTINIINKDLNKEIIELSIISILFVTIAIYISNLVHKKIKSDSFTKFVYTALCFSGLLMVA